MTQVVENATAIPTREELIQRAADLVPLLREKAPRASAEQRIPRENPEALEQSGILRATRPIDHGGYEIDTPTKIGTPVL